MAAGEIGDAHSQMTISSLDHVCTGPFEGTNDDTLTKVDGEKKHTDNKNFGKFKIEYFSTLTLISCR